jgi:hypothetical protein
MLNRYEIDLLQNAKKYFEKKRNGELP